jgi:hypothetical protein
LTLKIYIQSTLVQLNRFKSNDDFAINLRIVVKNK